MHRKQSLKWGSSGTGDGGFDGIMGITTFENEVYVCDGNNRIQKFDSLGTFITKMGVYGSGYGEFWIPWDIIVTNDFICVSENWNHRVQQFSYDIHSTVDYSLNKMCLISRG